MELRQLEYFRMVGTLKSFTHAAQKLHITQPCITNSIHKLEDELGVQLLDRTTKQVSLTEKGEMFLNRVNNILTTVNEATIEVQNYESHLVSLGLPPMIGAYLFPDIFLKLQKDLPEIKFQVTEKGSVAIQDMLENGDIDLAFMIIHQKSHLLEQVPLTQKEAIVCLPKNHRFTKRKYLTFEDLSNEKFILLSNEYVHHRIFMEQCTKRNFSPDVVFQTDKIETMKALIENGAGISVLMSTIVNDTPDIIKVPLKVPIKFSIGLAWRKDKSLSNSCMDTIQFFKDYYENESSLITLAE
ncbi:LysR family transcriptional regulator [Brevibacillus ginsengisoli]|uniref:LysR family transcriptional regulator n=1 Tax=Brevibacillus ginsengisoli TaxID=363854 RepID=UPI003CEA2BC6